MKIPLNNRHKSGLFFTTIVAGLCLILGETVRETIGAIIIGFALTWAFGSTSRLLRYCIGGLAVMLFIAPLVAALIDHHNAVQSYDKSLESFRSKLPEFAKEHPDIHDWVTVNGPTHNGTGTPAFDPKNPYAVYGGSVAKQPSEWDANGNPISTPAQKQYVDDNGNPIRILVVPDIGNVSFPSTMSDKDIAKALRSDSSTNRAPDWYLEALDAGASPDDFDQLTPPLDKPEAFNIKHAISDGAAIEVPSAILALLFFGSVLAEAKRFTSRFNKPVES